MPWTHYLNHHLHTRACARVHTHTHTHIYIYIYGIGERLVELNPVKMNSIKLTNNNTRWNEVRHGRKKLSKLEVVKRALNIHGEFHYDQAIMQPTSAGEDTKSKPPDGSNIR